MSPDHQAAYRAKCEREYQEGCAANKAASESGGSTPVVAAAAGSAPGDERIAFLREGKTDVLLALLGEIAEPAELGCSRNFFMIGLDRRFRTTTPEQLFDLIAGVLRERVPNAADHARPLGAVACGRLLGGRGKTGEENKSEK